MSTVYIGIDNGATGTIGILSEGEEPMLVDIPSRKEQDWTQKQRIVLRVDVPVLRDILRAAMQGSSAAMAAVERPFIGPFAGKAALNGHRAMEAVLIALEDVGCPFRFIDAREWQRAIFGKGVMPTRTVTTKKGTKRVKNDTKLASRTYGKRLFPRVEGNWQDFDGLLIAEYLRRGGTTNGGSD